jgi:hypothetical protein
MQAVEIGVVGVGEDDGVRAAAVARSGNSEPVEHDLMIGAVRRRLDDDAAADAQRAMHRQRRLDGRRRHLVRGAGPHRIALARAEDVELAVAGIRRRQRTRGARARIERQVFRHRAHPERR